MDGAQHCKCFPGKSSCPICRGTGWVTICDKCDGAGMKDNRVCGRCAGHGRDADAETGSCDRGRA